jgi:hypothetical protein
MVLQTVTIGRNSSQQVTLIFIEINAADVSPGLDFLSSRKRGFEAYERGNHFAGRSTKQSGLSTGIERSHCCRAGSHGREGCQCPQPPYRGYEMNHTLQAAYLAVLLSAGSALGADAPRANVQLTMLTMVNPQALALWDITNNSQDEAGNLDAKKINAASWSKLLKTGKALEKGGRTLATSSGVIAAAPGAKLQDEDNTGTSKAAEVQRYLDAKPAEFRKRAEELQKTGTSIVEAATKHDTKKLAELSDSLNEVCEDCHKVFWHPQQSGNK